jgi:hypothetical protein
LLSERLLLFWLRWVLVVKVMYLSGDLFVIDVNMWATCDSVELYEWSLEESRYTAGKTLAPAYDDRVRAKLFLDPGNELLDGAPVIGTNRSA